MRYAYYNFLTLGRIPEEELTPHHKKTKNEALIKSSY